MHKIDLVFFIKNLFWILNFKLVEIYKLRNEILLNIFLWYFLRLLSMIIIKRLLLILY